ncbi:MAG: DUF1501 domain-containing protein [Gemmataceae bacterium]
MAADRRDFLRTAVASSGLVAWSMTSPTFVTRTAHAAGDASKKGNKDTILVVVELTGGNDGLNTVVPFKDAEYAKLRPTLKLPTDQLRKVNDELGLHPSLVSFSELLQDGALGIVQGVGYPNPSQSHFRSMDIWQGGTLDDNIAEGWLGKALKKMPTGSQSFHLKQANQTSPLAMEGAPMRVPSIGTLDEFQLQMRASSGADRREQSSIIEGAANSSGKGGLLDFVSRTASNTYQSSKRLAEIGKNYQPKATYPNTPLAARLRLAAQLITAELGSRIFYVSIDGFDTHATQAPAHANLLGQVSGAIAAFYKDLKARGMGERVLVLTFSEFGRRARENGSRGTDHGSGAPLFLVGGRVRSGVIGKHPSLTELEMGNLQHHTDFRQVYASLLEDWLGVPHREVLGSEFKKVAVLRS